MRSVHINTYCTGGAAKAGLRIVNAIRQSGNDAAMLVLYKTLDKNEIIDFRKELSFTENYLMKVKNKLQVLQEKYKYNNKEELFSSYSSVWNVEKHRLVNQADVINLHWTPGFIDYPRFFKSVKKRIVITLHDYYPFSGGYHYPNSFFKREPYATATRHYLSLLEKCYKNNDVHFVGPSEYIIRQVRNNPLWDKIPCVVIKNPVSNSFYLIENKAALRGKFKLNVSSKVLLYINDQLKYKRKGNHLFEKLTPSLIAKGYTVITVGEVNIGISCKQVIQMGYVSDENLLNELYNISDLLLFTSLEENLPNTVSESLCAGTPVIAFANGGVVEMINEGVNGNLITNNDIRNFLSAIDLAFEKKMNNQTIASAAKETFSEFKAAEKYNWVYTGNADRYIK